MPIVGVDRLEARADDLHDFMLTAANQLCQRGAYALLVVSNQDAHTAIAELSMPTQIPAIRALELFQRGMKRNVQLVAPASGGGKVIQPASWVAKAWTAETRTTNAKDTKENAIR